MQYPFRVFANQNLGTQFDYTHFTSEWLNSKGTGQSPVLPEVNLATGNVILKSTIVNTQEQIGSWEFGFIYNAQSQTPWSMNLPKIISTNSGKIIFRERDGSCVIYTPDPNSDSYIAPSGAHARWRITQQPDNSWVQLDPETGARTIYDARGNITAVYDTRGLSMQYQYDNFGNLQTIQSAAGIYYIITNDDGMTSLSFTKTGEEDRTVLASWQFDLGYDAQLQLRCVTIANEDYSIHYAYDGANLTTVSQTDGTTVNLTYTDDCSAKLKTLQTGSAGAQYAFYYDTTDRTRIIDALGFSKTAIFDDQSHLVTWEEQVSDTIDDVHINITSCSYQENGDLRSITKPNSANTQFSFNDTGLITQKIQPNGQCIQYDYDTKTFERIIRRELISGSGDTAKWAVTRYVYNGKKLFFILIPELIIFLFVISMIGLCRFETNLRCVYELVFYTFAGFYSGLY